MSDTIPPKVLESMGYSSDSGTASSGSDSDHPHTPSPEAPRIRASTGGPYTAPSKIPKMSTAVIHPLSHSQPATPIDSGATSRSLDWGGGDWSILAEEVERKSTEMLPLPTDAGILPAKDSLSEHTGGQMTTSDAPPLQSPTRVSLPSSDHDCTSRYDAEHARTSSPFKESNDEDKSRTASALRAVVQPDYDRDVLHAANIPETELSDADDFHASGSDDFATRDINQPTFELKDISTAIMSEIELSDADASPDSDSVDSVAQDIDQPIIEPDTSNTATMLETDFSDTDVSYNSDTGDSVTQGISQPVIGPENSDTTTMLEVALSDRDSSHDSDSGESATKDVIQLASVPKDLDTTTMLETEISDADVSHDSDSDVSIIQLPTVRIRGPFLNVAMQDRPVKTSSGPSPQTILRGLIRDAHREMMYFTLPHLQFSLNDLRQGLDFAYSMLQAVTSKSAILNSLQDMNDTNDMSAADLRRWIAHVDDLDPQTRHEPRVMAIFESLSAGELKISLAELVQSRIIVEDEVKQTRALLLDQVMAKEGKERDAISTVDVAADHDEGSNGRSALSEFVDVDEPAWDALLTAIMIALFGALYISVRE
jgi:hypothetical protein